eukprot:UN25159
MIVSDIKCSIADFCLSYYMAIGTSGNQFKNASVVGHLMASLIEHSETKIKMVHSGFEVDMSKYSRLRELGKTTNVLA